MGQSNVVLLGLRNRMSETNPYASPPVDSLVDPVDEKFRATLDARDLVKVDAIIKKVSRLWRVIILCFLGNIICPWIFSNLVSLGFLFLSIVVAALVLPIWFSLRFFQWKRLAKKYPELLDSRALPESTQAKFNYAKWMLITGLVFGLMFLACLLFLFLILATVPLFTF